MIPTKTFILALSLWIFVSAVVAVGILAGFVHGWQMFVYVTTGPTLYWLFRPPWNPNAAKKNGEEND